MPQSPNWGRTDNWLDLAMEYPVSTVIQRFDQFMRLFESQSPSVEVCGSLDDIGQYIPYNVHTLTIRDVSVVIINDDFPCLAELTCNILYTDNHLLSGLTHLCVNELDMKEITIANPKTICINRGISRLIICSIDNTSIELNWSEFQSIIVTDKFTGELTLKCYARFIRDSIAMGNTPKTWGVQQFVANDIRGDDIVLDSDRYMCVAMSVMEI